jgi:hypothetical protein
MLFGSVNPSPGRHLATDLILNSYGGYLVLRRAQWGKDQLTVLAQPGFDQVATIIVRGHPYWIPSDGDVISIATRADIRWRIIELAEWQPRVIRWSVAKIPAYLKKFRLYPTSVEISPWFHVRPCAQIVSANDMGANVGTRLGVGVRDGVGVIEGV